MFSGKRDQAVNNALKTRDLTRHEIQEICANIPPVALRDVGKPADSDNEEAKQVFVWDFPHKVRGSDIYF